MKREHSYWVYMMTNPKKTALYIGMTNNLSHKISEHIKAVRQKKDTFAECNEPCHLVYFERYQHANHAVLKERLVKDAPRTEKYKLIETTNPDWKFLEHDFLPQPI